MDMKPCPFCASQDVRYSENKPDGYLFWCGNCGALGPNDISFEYAVKMWNLRRPEAALLKACKTARKEAAEIREWCASGQAVRANVRELIQTNAALIVDIVDEALAAARPQEAE